MIPLHKYPRTHHLEGSRLQPGDEDLDSVPFADIAGATLAVEEKIDGANSALSFGPDGRLWLQSRGHFLTGGPREKHFHLFKQWAAAHADLFWPVLGSRYVMFGEWAYAKHTIFYDELPHYFLEFDVLDTEAGTFLDTPTRQGLLANLPVRSVPVLARRAFDRPDDLLAFVGPSRYKSPQWQDRLAEAAQAAGLDPERVARQTDRSGMMEGLYLKVEEAGIVTRRVKFIRADFLTAVLESGSHWLRRPVVPNRLAAGVDLFARAP
jgi:hypothetical protein